MMMMNFIEKLFKKEPSVNYTIADYAPPQQEFSPPRLKRLSHQKSHQTVHDEMEIDNLYQKS
jgi:hypothetical protein